MIPWPKRFPQRVRCAMSNRDKSASRRVHRDEQSQTPVARKPKNQPKKRLFRRIMHKTGQISHLDHKAFTLFLPSSPTGNQPCCVSLGWSQESRWEGSHLSSPGDRMAVGQEKAPRGAQKKWRRHHEVPQSLSSSGGTFVKFTNSRPSDSTI